MLYEVHVQNGLKVIMLYVRLTCIINALVFYGNVAALRKQDNNRL